MFEHAQGTRGLEDHWFPRNMDEVDSSCLLFYSEFQGIHEGPVATQKSFQLHQLKGCRADRTGGTDYQRWEAGVTPSRRRFPGGARAHEILEVSVS